MSASTSPLELEGYFLKELNYSISDPMEEFPKGVENLQPVNLAILDTTRPLDAEYRRWRCELAVQSADHQVYDFKIVMVGFFAIKPGLDTEVAKQIAESNCPAVLYSTAREIVAAVTRRSPYPATLLPVVTFIKRPEKPKPAVKQPSSTSEKAIK